MAPRNRCRKYESLLVSDLRKVNIDEVDLKTVDLGSIVRVQVAATLFWTEIHRLSRIECDGSGNHHLGSLNQSFATNGLPKDQVITLSNPRPILARGVFLAGIPLIPIF